MSKHEQHWFESLGYGAGPPTAWQDWALYAAYGLTSVAGVLLVADRSSIGVLAIAACAIVLFLAGGVRRIRAGWRRFGSGENE